MVVEGGGGGGMESGRRAGKISVSMLFFELFI